MSDRTPKIYYYDNAADEQTESQAHCQQNRRVFRITLVVLFLLISVVAVALGWDEQVSAELGFGPEPTSDALDEIDTSHDPLQTPYTGDDVIKKLEFEGNEFKILPVAGYEISGILGSKKSYSAMKISTGDRWYAKIAPIDLCIVWGKLAEPEYYKYMAFSQYNRFCYPKIKEGSPLNGDYSYLNPHLSNNHIIPANENVKKAVEAIKTGDKIVLKGLLVNVDLNGNFILKTSVSRTDESDGACEIIYVKSVRIGNKIYG